MQSCDERSPTDAESDKQTELPQSTFTLDRLLSKYVAVWLWSILFGANTALLYSFMTLDRIEAWKEVRFLPATLAVISAGFLAWSWWFLILYLILCLIPRVFQPGIERRLLTDEEYSAEHGKHAGQYLGKAFITMFVSVMMRILVSVVEMIFEASLAG